MISLETKELITWLYKYPYAKLNLNIHNDEARIAFYNTDENGEFTQRLDPIYYLFKNIENKNDQT